jgi:hypothetical protein
MFIIVTTSPLVLGQFSSHSQAKHSPGYVKPEHRTHTVRTSSNRYSLRRFLGPVYRLYYMPHLVMVLVCEEDTKIKKSEHNNHMTTLGYSGTTGKRL